MTERVTADRGTVLAAFREPVGGHWHLFCLLPLEKVAPTPYQRDLSPTHVKRLHDAVKKIDRFVDPIVVRLPEPGVYWTPNGHHRLEALQKLKAELDARHPDPRGRGGLPDPRPQHGEGPQPQGEVAGGHPHVPRPARRASRRRARRTTPSSSRPPHLVTLGLLYEQNKRFAGGAFAPHPPARGRVPARHFRAKTLPQREARAETVARRRRRARGGRWTSSKARHPPPVREELRARPHHAPVAGAQDVPSFDQALDKLLANIEGLDVAKVRYDDVQRGR